MPPEAREQPNPGEPASDTPPPPAPRRRGPRTITLIAVGIAAIATGLIAWLATPGPPEAPDQEAGVALTEADIGGPFTLTDHNGRRVSDTDFRGRYLLVFFGFTHCPDVCPATLRDIAMTLDELGEAAEQIQPLFITVDPERDGPEEMAAYVKLFDSRILGLTGSDEEIARAVAAYRVYRAKVPIDDDGDYTMDHSPYVYLMDREGRYLAHFPFGLDPEEMAGRIEDAIETRG